jgi:pimeloyl-ACP methyl ester carboxylesterase
MTRPTSPSGTETLRRGSAITADGTPIGWLSLGAGPGLVIVHGAMQSALSQLDLARLLARHHEVHLVDRRGRGMSGPYPASANHLRTEIEDLTTVLAETGAQAVLGISSGALIALHTAATTPNLQRVAAFEPPLVVDDPARLDLLARTRRELDADDLPNALVTAMRAAEMGPPPMLRLPRPLRFLARRMLAAKPRPGGLGEGAGITEPPVRELAYALRADFAIVAEAANRLAVLRAVTTPVLLLDGTRTRPYLRAAVDTLTRTIPYARRVSLAGTDHGVTQNRKQWGRPERVAPTLLEFFTNASPDRPASS